jgi:hypothetical protein
MPRPGRRPELGIEALPGIRDEQCRQRVGSIEITFGHCRSPGFDA